MKSLTTVIVALGFLVLPAAIEHAPLAADPDASEELDPPTCTNAYGKTACGYHCVAGYGDVQCAETRVGACHAAYGQVVCWDPPWRLRKKARRQAWPQASCLAGYGSIACGYACTSGYGQVKCAAAPYGTCEASYGQVTCFP